MQLQNCFKLVKLLVRQVVHMTNILCSTVLNWPLYNLIKDMPIDNSLQLTVANKLAYTFLGVHPFILPHISFWNAYIYIKQQVPEDRP